MLREFFLTLLKMTIPDERWIQNLEVDKQMDKWQLTYKADENLYVWFGLFSRENYQLSKK